MCIMLFLSTRLLRFLELLIIPLFLLAHRAPMVTLNHTELVADIIEAIFLILYHSINIDILTLIIEIKHFKTGRFYNNWCS